MKVLYLHGLNSTLHDDRRKILEDFGLEITSPNIDYEGNAEAFDELQGNFDADMIIGSSAGGLAGYYLSWIQQVPALLFNPALPFRHYMPKINIQTDRLNYLQVVLGAKDDVVPAQESFDFLNKPESKNLEIHWIQDLEHSIPIDIFEAEVAFFIQKIQS